MMPETELAYAAGIFDGEGSVYVQSRKNNKGKLYARLDVRVGNTDERIILWLQKRWGGYIQIRRYNDPKCKTLYTWLLNDRKAADFIRSIRKYLILKVAQADLGVEFRKTVGRGIKLTEKTKHARIRIIQEVHVLNRRGREGVS